MTSAHARTGPDPGVGRIDPGKRAIEALDLIDQGRRHLCGATRSFGLDDEIGLFRIGLDLPRSVQHRSDHPFAPGNANGNTRRSLSERLLVVETPLEPTQ